MSALTDRDQNVQPTSQPAHVEKQAVAGEENKPQEHKTGMENVKQSGTYISPSDAILSPASQKLAGFKQRQINKSQSGKNSTSRLLFGRTPSGCSSGFDDGEANEEKRTDV